MPSMGKHRRFKATSLTRGIIAVGAGGAALVLPLAGATVASAAPAQSAAAEKAPTAVSAKEIAVGKGTVTTHSVIAGDSLSKIARAYSLGGGWQKLYEDNRDAVGGNPDLIHPGLKLSVGATSQAGSKSSDVSSDRGAGGDRADRSERTAAPQAAKGATGTAATTEANDATGTANGVADVTTDADTTTVPAEQPATYTDDLDGWIKESLAVMAQHGIPGSYDGIHRNIMRESSGNPQVVNNWDSNAAAGIPSKGLLQVIDPTFQAYHVPGTSMDSLDPVANITAACNYAADKYGSIDNVFGAY
ncbi:LysM peptidoglycan-binding domain-containing protein [Streptomyces sp. NBC_01433]|uniref:LysM peptidoglycan-binding domain-containing protein n=1 Tax=Streptomyces sp. NBC_01433 TaxID=2903864 RepID=UPI00225683F1|nr:LysM peptidoglycan-binding domain-containing protein [Streptomyces sp. NBC_01433]MCX4679540.1 LysM peptidoglycan-binding domain-containing protein [Streptomyces sp. NBC_01433]